MLVMSHQLEPKIQALDFTRFRNRLIRDYPEMNWEGELFTIAVEEYKRFLELIVRFPEVRMSPTKLMDTIWHHHILDTKNYHNDCNNIFGFYLHHKPTFEEVKSFLKIEVDKSVLHIQHIETGTGTTESQVLQSLQHITKEETQFNRTLEDDRKKIENNVDR